MSSWIAKLSDESFRTRLGRRFETLTEEAFNVLRWTVIVGFAKYLSLMGVSRWFDLIYWALSALLFGYLASRFLLRPEVPIFADTDARWKRMLQTVLNYLLCMAAFIVVMWVLERLVGGIAQYRFGGLT